MLNGLLCWLGFHDWSAIVFDDRWHVANTYYYWGCSRCPWRV